MKKALITGIVSGALLLAMLLTGCSSGVAQEIYDQCTGQLAELQIQYQSAQDQLADLEAENNVLAADLADANARLETANTEIADLKATYVLEGETTAETVANIARYYHETHTYSAADLFVCSDMAAEIWNMLETAGIESRLAVGNIDEAITDIIGSNHAWVLAEVEPGQWLAVETTGGRVVYKDENPLYYRGWYYDNPVKLKDYNYWIKEYNTRIELHNMLVAADQEAVELYNQNNSTSQLAIHEKLVDLIEEMRDEMTALMADINDLATSFSA